MSEKKKICAWCSKEITDKPYEIWNSKTGKLVMRLHKECTKDENLKKKIQELLTYGAHH